MKNFEQIFFSYCPRMQRVKSIIGEIAKTDIAVLIKGESGTGKELVAQTIHQRSQRRGKPFVKVNCAAIPKNLLESELFGFEKGAFTGAHLKKPGRFELANGGTIMLDEISEMDISLQSKLLQVLQDGQFSRLGGKGDISVDIRVMATTEDNLEKTMLENRLREDLFFRLNVMSITLPPLRERQEQILPLWDYFFDFYKEKYRSSASAPSSKTMGILKTLKWPGNIRELENTIKRIILLGEEETISELMKSNGDGKDPFRASMPTYSEGASKAMNLKQIGREAAETAERTAIQKALHEMRWNRRRTAQSLKISYKSLLYKMQKYRLSPFPAFQGGEERA